MLWTDAPRSHVVIAGLWAAYCPQAAMWWCAGAEPEARRDAIEEALSDIAKGKTLRQALEERGFQSILDEVPRYVEVVETFRTLHRHISAPERTLFFSEVFHRLPLSRRFGLDAAIKTLGGDWDNFYTYIWTFAFGVEDWARAIGIDHAHLRVETVSLLVQVAKTQPFTVPVWRFTDGHQAYIAMLDQPGRPLLWTVMTHFGDFKSVESIPAIWILTDRGEASVYQPPLDATDTIRLLKHVKKPNTWPLGAFDNGRCCTCAYAYLCWEDGRLRSEFVLREE